MDTKGNEIKKTAEEITEALQCKLAELDMSGTLSKFLFVTDQGSNLVKAFKNQPRLNCAAHLLNTVLKTAFNEKKLNGKGKGVTDLIAKCKSLVEYFKRSGKNSNLPSALVQECATRWNTKFDMLQSVAANFDTITKVLAATKESSRLANVSKYYLDRLVFLLEKFKTTTLIWECDKSATLHTVPLELRSIKDHLQEFIRTEREADLKYVGKKILKTLDEKFLLDDIHLVAAFLWPKYKGLKYFSDDEKKNVESAVEKQIRSTMGLPDDDETSSSPAFTEDEGTEEMEQPTATTSNESTSSSNSMSHREKYADSCDEDIDCDYKVELERYRAMKLPPSTPGTHNTVRDDPLSFWKDNAFQFPILSKLARIYLGCPATSASSERCFSVAGRVIEKRRTRLSYENVDACLFLHSLNRSYC